jgi:hypothetical protein
MVIADKDVAQKAERTLVATPAIEYRVERMPIIDHPEAHLAEILDRLNELGTQGWRVVSIDLTHHPGYSPAAQPSVPLPVLLERPTSLARPIEYRIEQMPIQEHPEVHLAELSNRFTELGRERWLVMSVDLTHHPGYSPAAQPSVPLPVLLGREV